jgi:AraC-like DNA-binding protein
MKINLLLFIGLFIILLESKENEITIEDRRFEKAQSLITSDPFKALVISDSLLFANRFSKMPDWKIWDLQSKIYLQIRNTSKSIELAQKADSSYRFYFHKPHSDANKILAISYKDRGNLPRALYYYQIASDNAVDTLNLINILFNMAEVELIAGDTISADNHLESNIQRVRSIKSLGHRGIFYMQYASYLSGRHNHSPKILSYYLQATNILEKIKDYERAGFSAVGVAKEYQRQNRPDSCFWWFDKALSLQKLSGRPLGLADIYLNLANSEFENENYKAALNLYQKAWPYAQQANYLPITEEILRQLSVTYEKIGDYQSSILFLKRFNRLKDSVGKENWLSELSELQTRYAIKKKDEQLKKLQERVVFFETIPWFSITLSVLLLGVGVIWILKVKRRKRLSHELNPERESFKTKALTEDRFELWTELLHVLEDDKLYRDPDMNLTSFAQRLKTNRTTLSEVINYYGNRSFSNLINHYRVKEACELLCNPSAGHLTIEGIGINTGFKSRSAFYAAFTSEMGETPSAFRTKSQQHIKNDHVC